MQSHFGRAYLFDLGEVLINVPIEFKLADVADWNIFFRPHLCRIEDVEIKIIL